MTTRGADADRNTGSRPADTRHRSENEARAHLRRRRGQPAATAASAAAMKTTVMQTIFVSWCLFRGVLDYRGAPHERITSQQPRTAPVGEESPGPVQVY